VSFFEGIGYPTLPDVAGNQHGVLWGIDVGF
jgi:hypothetical protein